MTKIDISQIDRNLLADLDGTADGCDLYEFPYEQATVLNQRYQLVWSAENSRAGIVFVGSGSSGDTAWTDAASPEDAMRRYLADDTQP
jgi:hypothetical protein